jgi:hypothetical protein
MRLPGFTAEQALGASRRSYRSGAGGPAPRGGVARPAVWPNPRIQYQQKDVTSCTDCNGLRYECALTERCAKLCTTDGQGLAWCMPR